MCIKYSNNSLFTFIANVIIKKDMIISVVENHSNTKKKKYRVRCESATTGGKGRQSQHEWDKRDQGPAVNSTMTTDNDTTHP